MARRPFTFVMIADDRTTVRQYHITRFRVGLILAAIIVFAVGTGGVIGALVTGDSAPAASQPLAAENALLERELDDMQRTVDTLRTELADLTVEGEYLRLLAGVPPIDDDILAVGVGGPGSRHLTGHPLYDLDQHTASKAFFAATDLDVMVRRARLLRESWRVARDNLLLEYDRLAATPSILPTTGYISSTFSHERWHPILGRTRPHYGLDIVAPTGTPIVAAARGRVRFVGRSGQYGLTVEIDHGFGFVTRYAHASEVKVRRGQTVERGEIIALVGQTGLAIGPHLHYEVLVDDQADDPRKYILDNRIVAD